MGIYASFLEIFKKADQINDAKDMTDLLKMYREKNATAEDSIDATKNMLQGPGGLIVDIGERATGKDTLEPIKDIARKLESNAKRTENFYKGWTSDNNGNDLTEAEKYIRDRNIAREAIEEAKRTIRYKMEDIRNIVKNNDQNKVKLNELLKKYEDGGAMTTEDKKEYERLKDNTETLDHDIYGLVKKVEDLERALKSKISHYKTQYSDYESEKYHAPTDKQDGFDPDEKYHEDSTLMPSKDPFNPCHKKPISKVTCDQLDEMIDVIKKYMINTYDPIVLDLNGDGKISINKRTDSGVYFDYLGDGTSIKTSWVGKEDGILVFDKNNDGKINDGSELLGNFTQKSDGSTTKHGYDALSLLDSNKDGVIDAKDEGFVNLKVWQDANSNGIVDEGEMKKLSELNISSLNLTHQTENKNLEDRNKITHVGSYTMTDGSSRTMADIEFSVLPSDSKVKVDEKYIKNHITGVNVGGTGRLADLAIAANISSDLSGLLCMYDMLDSKEKQMGILDELLYEWAKTDSKFSSYNIELLKAQEVSQGEADSKTTIISLTPSQARSFREQMANGCKDEALLSRFESSKRKIQVVSAMMGMDLSKHYYSTDERLKKFLDTVDTIYDNLKSDTYRILLPQTRLKEYMERLYVVVDRDGNISYDSSRVIHKFKEINLSDPKKAFVDLAEFATLFQSKKDFAAGLSLLAEFAYGANKRGVLSEYIAAIGQETQNKLDIATITSNSSGTNANDIMVGSTGADTLYGGNGNDILYGGEGNDKLYGGNDNDILYGSDGDDDLYGEAGNDILEGGAGNDRLEGGDYDDTYIFGRGDGSDTIYDRHGGNDTIKFKEGIGKENITFQRVANDLVLKYGENDAVRINNQFGGSSIEQIALASGEYITASKINKIIEDLNAYASNNGMSNISMDDMKNNPDIMQMFASGWGN